jgi:hypothetical protein
MENENDKEVRYSVAEDSGIALIKICLRPTIWLLFGEVESKNQSVTVCDATCFSSRLLSVAIVHAVLHRARLALNERNRNLRCNDLVIRQAQPIRLIVPACLRTW